MQVVAGQAGVSVGFISQVERGISAPSLASLVSLADVLALPLGQFLTPPRQAPGEAHMTRKGERELFAVPGAVPKYERLSSSFAGSVLHSVIVHEEPGSRSEPISHTGEEMFFILEGELTVEIAGKSEILKAGDSVHFDSRKVHSSWNHTTRVTRMVWCGTMDVFGGRHPPPIRKKNIACADDKP